MYYELLRSLDELLGEEGLLRLPPYLPRVFILDEARKNAIEIATKYAIAGKNVLLIGPPGTGKTALMFMILQKLSETNRIGYIREGITSIGKEHEEQGVILFYDDIPRMNREAIKSIVRGRTKNIVATARREELDLVRRVLGIDLLDVFQPIEVPPMSKEKLREMLYKYAEEEAIRIAEREAVEEVVEKAQGLPVYIWQVIRELKIRREPLTIQYAKTIPQGMLDYIDDILWRTLGGKPERYEALLTLLCMTDFTKYAVHQDLYNYIYLVAKENRIKRRVGLEEIMMDQTLEAITRYLARESTTYAFRLPHDSWADVLRGKSRGPMATEISKINLLYNKKKRQSIVLEAARRAWSEALEETEEIFRKETFKNNITINLGKIAWEDIEKGIPAVVPTPQKPKIEERAIPIKEEVTPAPPADPLKILKQTLASMGLAPKEVLAKKIGISKAELESLLEIADFAVKSKRPGFIYYKDHIITAIKRARDILQKRGIIRLEELAKITRMYPEDLEEKIRDIAIIHGGVAYHRESIIKTIISRAMQRGYVVMQEILQTIPREVLTQIEKQLRENLIESPTKQKFYTVEYLEKTVPKLIEALRTRGMATIEELVRILDIPRRQIEKYIGTVAEKSPTTPYYYPKGTIEKAKQKIGELAESGEPIEQIAKKLGIAKSDTEKIMRDKGIWKEWIHQRTRKILLDAEGYPERIPDEQIRELEKLL
ncbi:MAG: ATP-binding protein, partial [Candidatus Njordarchaeota archaeon]